MNNKLVSAFYLVFVGFCFGSAVGLAVSLFYDRHHSQAIQALEHQHFENVVKAQEVIGLWQDRAEKCEAKFHRGIALYDFEPMKGLDLGPIVLQPQMQGKLVGGVRLRWIVPADVQPVVYGDSHGAVYFKIDPNTGKVEGPFAPEENSMPEYHK